MEWLYIAGRRIGIPSYAERRMTTRNISTDEARAVIADPTTVKPSRHSSFRLVFRRSVRGRRIAVVVEGFPGKSHWVVVTAWEEGQDG
jgi:hypothetical protein